MISDLISDDIPPQYGKPHSNTFLQVHLKLECCKPRKASCHPTKCHVINDVKLFPTVYRRIYCCIFLMLSNQMSCYKSKCIRMIINQIYDIICLFDNLICDFLFRLI